MLFLSDSVYRMDDLDTDEYIRRIRALNAIKDRWFFILLKNKTNFNFFVCVLFLYFVLGHWIRIPLSDMDFLEPTDFILENTWVL